MGKTAWFALKNSKTRTAPHRSRGQTRPRLERGCRAPAAAACSHAAAAPAPRALPRSGRCRRPRRVYLPGGPPADRLAPPSCGSPGMTARTHEPEPAPGLDPGVRRITPRAHQLDHLPPELRRIRNMCLGHGQHLSRKLRGVHRTGATSVAPVDDLALLLGDMVAAILVELKRQGGHPGSDQGQACYITLASTPPDGCMQQRRFGTLFEPTPGSGLHWAEAA